MAVITKDGVTIQIKNIISYYCEEDDIHDNEDVGTYESFDMRVEVNGAEVLSHVLEESCQTPPEGMSFELCSGNILSLIQMIEEGIETGEYQEIDFLEPNFSFELNQNKGSNQPSYRFQCWINSGNWEGIYGGTDMGFRFSLKENELKTFLEQLKQEWDNRKKEQYS
jgi:hypothetical protein